MPNADFFTRFGLFVSKDFFDPELCSRIRSEMQSASSTPAMVVEREGPEGTGGVGAVDENTRRTKSAEVSAQTLSSVEQRLLTLKPMLEQHFSVPLSGSQKPGFLVYEEGDFFRPHPDNSAEPDAPEYLKERKVSVVIFLNDQAESNDETEDSGGFEGTSYRGGSLTFYGLIDDSRSENIGFPLTAETGLLVAFRSDVLHGVTPVTHGKRFTIVTWFR